MPSTRTGNEPTTTADLRDELIARNAGPLEGDPLDRIWKAVVYQGLPLEEVVDDLMRERDWHWHRSLLDSIHQYLTAPPTLDRV